MKPLPNMPFEQNHYYPFGLTMRGISANTATNAPANKRKFNDGTELESVEFSDGSGLEFYTTDFRSYDAQIGRFHQIDLLTELNMDNTGYIYSNNNPILFNDPFGLDTLKRNADGTMPTVRADGSKLQDVDVILGDNGQVSNYFNGESWQAPKELEGVTVSSSKKPKEVSNASAAYVNNNTTQQSTPNTNISRGQREAEIALAYPGRDLRPYSMSDAPNTIDCSRFTREVAKKAGYNIPRVAFDQARWYQQNGQWNNNVNNAQAGDHIFWQRGTNAYHTGVVVSNIILTNGTRIIQVVQAQTYNHRPGSIQLQRLMPNGQIRGFGQPFVGVGRYP